MAAQVRSLVRGPGSSTRIAGAIVACVGLIASSAMTVLSGTKTGIAIALASIFGPFAIYAAMVAPLVFPFTLYVALVPFDNVLDFSSFGTVTRLLAAFAGVAIAVYLARTRRAVRVGPALGAWIAFFAWAAATAFWAIDQPSVFVLLPTALQLLLLYAAISILPADRTALRWVTSAALAGGVFAAAYGTYLFRSGFDVGRGNRLWITTDTSFIDPNHFAAALLLPIALAVALVLYARKPLAMFAWAAAAGVMLEGVAVTASRGAMLGIAAIAVYLFVRSPKRWRLAAFGVPAAGIALAIQPALFGRLGGALASGGSGRLDIWKVGVVALKSHWLLGAGYNNFAFAYDQAFLGAHQLHFAQWHRAPHNLLLGTAVELGVVGVALLLTAWYAQFRMLRVIPPEDADYPFRMALEAALIATFVAALFLDVMVMKYIWLTFTVVAILHNAHIPRAASLPLAGAQSPEGAR